MEVNLSYHHHHRGRTGSQFRSWSDWKDRECSSREDFDRQDISISMYCCSMLEGTGSFEASMLVFLVCSHIHSHPISNLGCRSAPSGKHSCIVDCSKPGASCKFQYTLRLCRNKKKSPRFDQEDTIVGYNFFCKNNLKSPS